jgi:hypothetical protein
VYADCLFFAEKTSARKGAALSGAVLVVARKLDASMRNGSCVKALGTPRAEPGKLAITCPVATWVSLAWLTAHTVPVSEADARTLAPAMFAAIDSYQGRAEFRAMHPIAVAEAIHAGRYSLQSADAAVNARLGTTRPEETDGPTGWTHKGGRRARRRG